MTLLFMEGWENHTGSTSLSNAGYILANKNWPSIDTGTKKTGNRAMYLFTDYYAVRRHFPIAANNTIIMGFAYYWGSAQSANYSNYKDPTIGFHTETYSKYSSHQLAFLFSTLGRIRVYRGSTYIGTTSIDVVRPLAWDYYEIKYYAHQSAGTIDILKNGNNVLSLSGIDTCGAASTNIAGFEMSGIGGGYSPGHIRIDDIYILDTGGAAPYNDYLGEMAINAIRPNADGNYLDFAPSAGANYQCVDEVAPDGADYNTGDSAGEKDSYEMQTLSDNGGTVYAVKHTISAKKTNLGIKKISSLMYINSSDYLGDELDLTTSLKNNEYILELNPDTSLTWTHSDINAAEIGAEITT